MARGILLVFSDPSSPERDDEYNRWYTETHLKEVLQVEGIVAATRYRRLAPTDTGIPSENYLAVYELEADDLSKVEGALVAGASSFNMSDAIRLSPPPGLLWYLQISDRAS